MRRLAVAILLVPAAARGAGIDGAPRATFAWPLGEDLQYMGSSAAIGDFDGDGRLDLALGASLVDAGGLANTGRIDVFYGTDDGFAATADLTLVGEADTLLAYAMVAADVNGDGRDDLVATVLSGAWVYYGSVAGLPAVHDAEITPGEAPLARAGDVNADGFADVLLADGTRHVTLYLGSAGGLVAGPTFADSADFAAGDFDVDGDGISDVVLGDASADGDKGVARVYRGSEGGVGEAAFGSVAGSVERVGFGRVLGAGDVDGDGLGDVAVSSISESFGNQNSGTVKLFGGASDGLDPAPRQTWSGREEGSNLGWMMAGPADFDGDGYADVVLAGRSLREVYVYAGGSVPSGSPADTVEYGGTGVGAALGLAVGDVDDDGCDDLLVGGPGSEGAVANLYAGACPDEDGDGITAPRDCDDEDPKVGECDDSANLKGGCGCSSDAVGPASVPALLAFALMFRRRRQVVGPASRRP